ncbi:MAG TPA: 23S rRNA (pseudouridine(1915)-N(3))-methyltransferase RlmH [Saprospiraceae bacterium]|nr:23S rRNA (pseudouridine(1915)-N(3))-methyltransferase RlmH [Saprospiraceae bacterium]
MKVHLWALGAASDPWVVQGEELYKKRIERYMPFEYKCIQTSKSKIPGQVLSAEAKWLTQQIQLTPTFLVLLDEKGKQQTSVQLATQLEKWRQGSHKQLVFVIGSSFGFDPSVYQQANALLGLSLMTFPHQLARLMVLEQLYRACTIQKGESYHHI